MPDIAPPDRWKDWSPIHRCQCCGYRTLPEPPDHQICEVCFWQEDGQGDEDADMVLGGPNYDLSLTRARLNYAQLGACDRKHLSHVRPPLPEEL
jgi:hypothetical protein